MARQVKGQMVGASGKVGNVTYYQQSGETYVRTATNTGDVSRVESVMYNRVRLANVVAMYRAGSAWAEKSFQGKLRTQSDYNKFVQLNFPTSPVALTKDEVANGACVVAPYYITRGTLPSVAINKTASAWYTNIKLGDLSITADTTVIQFTEAVLKNNVTLQEGDQISFISYQQATNAVTGVPYVVCASYEVVLSGTDKTTLRSHLPIFCSTSIALSSINYLGTGSSLSAGGFAYIVSRNTRRGLLVSTQKITMTSTATYDNYSSSTHLAAAMESYGLEDETFLDTTSTHTAAASGDDPVDVPLSLLAMSAGLNEKSLSEVTYSPNSQQNAGTTAANWLRGVYEGFKFNNTATITKATMNFESYNSVSVTNIEADADNDTNTAKTYWVTWPVATTAISGIITSIVLTLSDSTEITIPFGEDGNLD